MSNPSLAAVAAASGIHCRGELQLRLEQVQLDRSARLVLDDHAGRVSGEPSPGSARAEAQAEEEKSTDKSVQEFGSEAGEAERAEVIAALRSFVRALGTGDYRQVCDDISAKMVSALQTYTKLNKQKAATCPELLAKLVVNREPQRAKHVLGGLVTHVRVGKGSAFIVVKPTGERVSFFALAREGDAWKATSISLGTPLLAGPG